MNSVKACISASIAVLGLALASPAQAQSVAEEFIFYPSEPDVYFFFEETDRKEVTDYKKDQIVRVCVDKSDLATPLAIYHDGEQSQVAPGDCIRVEGKEIALEPAKPLERRTVLRAEVSTLQAS